MFGLFHELPRCFAFQCSGPLPTNSFFPLHFLCYFPFTILHPRVVPCTLVCAPVPSCSPAPWCNSLRPCAPCCIPVLCCLLILPCAQSYALLHNRQSCALLRPRAPSYTCALLYPCGNIVCLHVPLRVPSCDIVCPPAPVCGLLHPRRPSHILCPPATSCALLQHRVPSCTFMYPHSPSCAILHPHMTSSGDMSRTIFELMF
jgi:hypothetical protein